jgi:hypothetical protein
VPQTTHVANLKFCQQYLPQFVWSHRVFNIVVYVRVRVHVRGCPCPRLCLCSCTCPCLSLFFPESLSLSVSMSAKSTSFCHVHGSIPTMAYSINLCCKRFAASSYVCINFIFSAITGGIFNRIQDGVSLQIKNNAQHHNIRLMPNI